MYTFPVTVCDRWSRPRLRFRFWLSRHRSDYSQSDLAGGPRFCGLMAFGGSCRQSKTAFRRRFTRQLGAPTQPPPINHPSSATCNMLRIVHPARPATDLPGRDTSRRDPRILKRSGNTRTDEPLGRQPQYRDFAYGPNPPRLHRPAADSSTRRRSRCRGGPPFTAGQLDRRPRVQRPRRRSPAPITTTSSSRTRWPPACTRAVFHPGGLKFRDNHSATAHSSTRADQPASMLRDGMSYDRQHRLARDLQHLVLNRRPPAQVA